MKDAGKQGKVGVQWHVQCSMCAHRKVQRQQQIPNNALKVCMHSK